MNAHEFYALKVADLPWEERFNEKLQRALFRKELLVDHETGVVIRLVRSWNLRPGRKAAHAQGNLRSRQLRVVSRGRTHGARRHTGK